MLPLTAAAALVAGKIGIKAIKYFVDATFRDKVVPRPGSVVYCDLWIAVEHSGIYVGDGQISNIVVDGVGESTVCLSEPDGFTSKSILGRKIYVSSNSAGSVGHPRVGQRAQLHVGERAFYGLVIKNCHQFSIQCVDVAEETEDEFLLPDWVRNVPDETWERTIADLKGAARRKLGATKWRLWAWDSKEEEREPEPDWKAHTEYFKNLPLNEEMIANLRSELAAAEAYEAEIADEVIPSHIRARLRGFRQTLADISAKYEEVKGFLAACPGASFSYADLHACTEDFGALTAQLQSNPHIRDLARKMGRNFISEQKKKKQARIPQASRSEVHGTQRSDDVMRTLPSELVNLEDETLELLFYARLLEKSLLSYELSGTTLVQGETSENQKKRTGPVVACLDTSGSMQGAPIMKAKALLLAIANILKQEDRSLHVLLFGGTGEIREFSMDAENKAADLLMFLNQGFGGGTDFETPLRCAMKIISAQPSYLKADVLMISDGDCNLSMEFITWLTQEARRLDCSIYSVLCAGGRIADNFSDEVVVL